MRVFDPRNESALRQAFGRFATGVALVSACDASGKPIAITVNSLASLSLAPALLLWSVAHRSAWHDAFVHAGHFAVQVLGADQLELSHRFGGRQAQAPRFEAWRAEPGMGGVPLLPASLACFECEQYAVYPGGDHSIVVGQILALSCADAEPLLFHGGRYRHLGPEVAHGPTSAPAPEPADRRAA